MPSSRVLSVFYAAFAVLALAPAQAENRPATLDLRKGQEIIFTAEIVDGKVVLGLARIVKLGAEEPKAGEIAVGLKPNFQPYYAELQVKENTSAPIDFVAAAMIGGTKIDEVALCGLLDAAVSARTANAAWRNALDRFEPGKGGDCR